MPVVHAGSSDQLDVSPHNRYLSVDDPKAFYTNLPPYLGSHFPMLGTKKTGTNKSNRIYAPFKMIGYMIRYVLFVCNEKAIFVIYLE